MKLAQRGLCIATTVAVSACAVAGHGEGPSAGASVRVMTYNIFGGKDLERRSNLERIAALIDTLRVDVVFLQEVDRLTGRSGRVDQADTIARLAGMRAVFGRAMEFDGGEYGIAVLSRWPITSWRVVPLSAALAETTTQPPEPRALLHVVVESPRGAIHVLNTHLDHQRSAAARHSQLVELMAYVADSVPRDAHVVLGGDFNARPETAEMRAIGIVFGDSWALCGRGSGDTFRSDAPNRRIDYVLLAGARCERARVLDTRASDHRPVLADVVLQD